MMREIGEIGEIEEQDFRIETGCDSEEGIVGVMYLQARDYFDAYEKALKFCKEVVAVMTVKNYFHCVVRGKMLR